ncbi:hypothetical protein GOP47_0014036 [Adiantum capillus-veneris]|uniref:Aminotransferase class I/classII large domain-containing protein n=1 Tax=Adiantum capillus-veneris TaxID=13818 RepID=A0A9D4ZFZ1_ADICA|nr:hypothetical protein GOP47_0014036 [Adiantum capillus-veneris]
MAERERAEGPATQVPRNTNLRKLHAGYLFPEINRRREAHLLKSPQAKLINLGPGDTTEPIPPVICAAMELKAKALSTSLGYTGYGFEPGLLSLRSAIAHKLYSSLDIKPTEIFVSDGAKCDIARLQLLFGPKVSVAVQDPCFPVYVDTSVIVGQTGGFLDHLHQYNNVAYMRCTPENSFFPDLSLIPRTDIIFFCSPSNPTGVAASKTQLERLVGFAKANGSIIVYDSAYAMYISDGSPKSIYEIPGAREVAVEISSFSKCAGFAGVRLGWTIVPEDLRYSDGSPVIDDCRRIMATCFGGASNIAQAGGIACLSMEGLIAMHEVMAFYKENAQILLKTFISLGFKAYGGADAPYVWVKFEGRTSWDAFSEVLENVNVVTAPGSGFGPAGEGFLRVSAFAHREDIIEVSNRLKAFYTSSVNQGTQAFGI